MPSKATGSTAIPAGDSEADLTPPHDPVLAERPEITQRYNVEVLHTSKGLLKGRWGEFQAAAFYRELPSHRGQVDSDIRMLRHILIKTLDIGRYAERDGETLMEVEELGEGSYSTVYGAKRVAAKVISDRERPWVHKAAVENAIEADRLALGPRIFGHGTLEQLLGGSFKGTVIFMERLEPLGDQPWSEADVNVLLKSIQTHSQSGFHNDLKPPNILRRAGVPVLIDFDLRSQWAAKVAVTSSCIDLNFQARLEPLGEPAISGFREYYDLFALSLALKDGLLYRSVLRRLSELWSLLANAVLEPILRDVPQDKIREIPYEVIVRVPLHGVTVSFLDLRGNLFCHLAADGGDASTVKRHLEASSHLPQLQKSNGVYWPDEE